MTDIDERLAAAVAEARGAVRRKYLLALDAVMFRREPDQHVRAAQDLLTRYGQLKGLQRAIASVRTVRCPRHEHSDDAHRCSPRICTRCTELQKLEAEAEMLLNGPSILMRDESGG